jgi:hypothetical protein
MSSAISRRKLNAENVRIVENQPGRVEADLVPREVEPALEFVPLETQ